MVAGLLGLQVFDEVVKGFSGFPPLRSQHPWGVTSTGAPGVRRCVPRPEPQCQHSDEMGSS